MFAITSADTTNFTAKANDAPASFNAIGAADGIYKQKTLFFIGTLKARLISFKCLSTPESAARNPAYNEGKSDKNATAIGAVLAPVQTSKIKSTANVGKDLRKEIKGVKNKENQGSMSAITAKIVMKMLHKNPVKRYQTPQALLNALNEVLQRYPADVAKSIIRSAVIGTELPHGVKKTVSAGMRAGINFMFFSFRQSIADFFHPTEKNKVKPDNSNTADGSCFTFQIEQPADKTVDFIISVKASATYKITSLEGYCKEIKSSDTGLLEIKGLSPGEYRVSPQNSQNL